MVPNPGLTWNLSERRGTYAVPPKIPTTANKGIKKATEYSFLIKGAQLYNCIDGDLRKLNQTTITVSVFKNKLDKWLENIPDEPTIPGQQHRAKTNSIVDQILYTF